MMSWYPDRANPNSTRPLAALWLVLFGLFASQRVAAATLVDTLDGWSLTSGHSNGLEMDTSNPQFFNGDASRVKLDGTTTGSFGYHLKNITAFTGSVYYFKYMGVVEAYSSPDGTNWSKVKISFRTPTQIGDGPASAATWYVTTMSARDLPDGTNYLGFSITSQPQLHPEDFAPTDVFTPQIGEITITYGGASIPAPVGLTALSATSQVCLNWLPSMVGTSYTVKRSTDGLDYHIIAQDVSATTYMDTTAKTGNNYYYGVSTQNDNGSSDMSDVVTATPKAGTVVFSDSLIDMALITGHTKNLTNGLVGHVSTIKRTKPGIESFYYNMPGLTDFAFNVYYSGNLNGQISAEVSPDGDTWTPLSLVNSDPQPVGQGMMVTVCSPVNKVPNDSNYLRFSLGAADGTDVGSPQVAQVRLTYGEAQHKPTDTAISFAKPSGAAVPAAP